jgi:hypothetical protein
MTSRVRAAVITGFLVATIAGGVTVTTEPKGERVTVTGEPVDMWCFLEAGDRGPGKKSCATDCANGGNPIAIVDNNGILYVTAALKSHESSRALLIGKMSEQVTVTGTLVRKNGLRMLYIDSVR